LVVQCTGGVCFISAATRSADGSNNLDMLSSACEKAPACRYFRSVVCTPHIFLTGPSKAGYFQWMQDEETGEMKPVTRMRKKNIERNPNYWDRVFNEDDK
jgi:hypothetical protein